MSRTKRLFCMLLVCMIAGASTCAEEPVPEVTAASTAAVTQAPTAEPTAEPTIGPTAEPTAEPPAEPTNEPTAEPTVEPTAESSAEPTIEPTTEPNVEPTAEPTVVPVSPIEITVDGGMQQADSVWLIAVQNPEEPVVFRWTPVESATVYEVRIADSQSAEVHSPIVTEAALSLPASALSAESYTLTVCAYAETIPEEGSDSETEKTLLAQGKVKFALVQNTGEFPGGGRPGGFGGGGRPGGNSGGGSMQGGATPEADQGFRIVPGEALTSSHSSGNKDMQIYGTVNPEAEKTAMDILTLDGVQLDVVLDDRTSSFFAACEDNVLILTPESEGKVWSVNAFVLKILSRSGIEKLRLRFGTESVEISTHWRLQGQTYARLCAEGYVSKDYFITVTLGEIQVTVAEKTYTINENNELAGG